MTPPFVTGSAAASQILARSDPTPKRQAARVLPGAGTQHMLMNGAAESRQGARILALGERNRVEVPMRLNSFRDADTGGTAVATPDPDGKRAELITLLLKRKVPEKAEILRVKGLIRDLSRQPGSDSPNPEQVKIFISAYLDLYLGRMTGERTIEMAGLRRCLACIGAAASH